MDVVLVAQAAARIARLHSIVVVGFADSVYDVYGMGSMVGFAEGAGRVVDVKKVAAVDLCDEEVVHGDGNRVRTLRTAKHRLLQLVEG